MTLSIIFSVFIVGAALGSFLNVCIHRLPQKKSLVFPGSSCPECNTSIKPYHNIPVLSYLLLRGRCAYCGARISLRYPIIELLTPLIALFLFWRFGLSAELVYYTYFYLFLIVISFIDLDTYLILNKVLIAFFVGGVILNFWLNVVPWKTALLGAVSGGGVLFLFALFGQWYFKKESMGMGDVKFATVLGFFLGWKLVLLSLYTGYLFAFIYIIILKIKKKQPTTEYIPMGPFFSLASIVWLSWWKELLDLYLTLII